MGGLVQADPLPPLSSYHCGLSSGHECREQLLKMGQALGSSRAGFGNLRRGLLRQPNNQKQRESGRERYSHPALSTSPESSEQAGSLGAGSAPRPAPQPSGQPRLSRSTASSAAGSPSSSALPKAICEPLPRSRQPPVAPRLPGVSAGL